MKKGVIFILGVLLLVSSCTIYYPGWTATVEGEAVELGRGNYVLRAMPVTAGHHEEVLSFFPKSLDTTRVPASVPWAASRPVQPSDRP